MLLLPLALLTGAALAWSPKSAPCSPRVIALATGIHLNIEGQYAEYNGSVKILHIEAEKPINMTAFYIAKGELLSDIQTGMNIRLFNQQIAPPGNAAIPGLNEYQRKEIPEQDIAEGLTGDPSHDTSQLETLKSDVLAGIKLNEDNLKKATEHCDFTLVFPTPDEMG